MSQGHELSMPAAGYSKAVDWWSLGVLVYKLLVGRYPFPISKDLENNRQEVPSLEVICGPVDYSTLEKDKPAALFITNLLQVTETNRLGYGDKGHYHVMNHPYFSFIDWTRLELKLLSPPPVRTLNILGSTNRYHNLVDMLVQNGKESWLTPNATDSADLTQFDDNSAFFSWHYASRDAVALELRSQKRSKSLSLTGHQTPDASMKSSAHFDSSRSRSSRSVTASYSHTI
jgi:serine/threonine protein kinase